MLVDFLKHLEAKLSPLKIDQVPDESLLQVPTSATIEDIEKYMPKRRNFRVCFTAHDIPALIDYIRANINQSDSPLIFISPESLEVEAVYDWRDNGHCRQKCKLVAPKSPEYKQYLKLIDRSSFGQRLAVQFVEDWSHCLSDPSLLLKCLRSIDIKAKKEQSSEVKNLSANQSVMQSVELANDEMPEEVIMTFTPSESLTPVEAKLRIVLHFDDDVPSIKFMPVRPDVVQQQIAQDFRDVLVRQLTEGNADYGQHVYIGCGHW